MEGDDANEFLQEFAEAFEADLGALLWYFHYNADEPPYVQRVCPFSPDGQRLRQRPIKLGDLVAAAEAGQWTVTYPPPHEARETLLSKLFRWHLAGFALTAAILWAWTRFGP